MSLKPDLNNSSKSDNRTGSPWANIDSGLSGPDLISFDSDVEIGTAEPDLINFDSDAEIIIADSDWTTIDDGSPWASPDLDIFGPNLISFDSDIEIETAGPNLVNLNPDVEIGTANSNQTITGTIDTDIETSDSDWTDVEVTEMDTDFSITSSECSHQLVVNMMTQTDDNDVVQAADMDSTDSRPASLRCPESGNTDDEIQVSFSHAELALNLNERFTQYRERTKSFIQHSQDDGVVGEDRDSGMVHLTPRPPQIGAHTRGEINVNTCPQFTRGVDPSSAQAPQVSSYTRGVESASQTDFPRQYVGRADYGLDFLCDNQLPRPDCDAQPQQSHRGRPTFINASTHRGRSTGPMGRVKGQGHNIESDVNPRGHSVGTVRGRASRRPPAPRQGTNREQLIVYNSYPSWAVNSQRDQVSSKRDNTVNPMPSGQRQRSTGSAVDSAARPRRAADSFSAAPRQYDFEEMERSYSRPGEVLTNPRDCAPPPVPSRSQSGPGMRIALNNPGYGNADVTSRRRHDSDNSNSDRDSRSSSSGTLPVAYKQMSKIKSVAYHPNQVTAEFSDSRSDYSSDSTIPIRHSTSSRPETCRSDDLYHGHQCCGRHSGNHDRARSSPPRAKYRDLSHKARPKSSATGSQHAYRDGSEGHRRHHSSRHQSPTRKRRQSPSPPPRRRAKANRHHNERGSDETSDPFDSDHSGHRSRPRHRDSDEGREITSHVPSHQQSRHHKSKRDHKRSESRRPHDRIKLGHFDGRTDVETFLAKFRAASKYNRWSRDDQLAHLTAALTGNASMLLYEIDNLPLEEVVTKLRTRFGTQGQTERFRTELKFRKRRPGETLQELAAEIERLARRAFPTASADIRDHLTRDAFVDALDPSDLSLRVRVQEPKTLQDALTSAIKLEVVLNQMEKPKMSSKNPLPRGTELDPSSRAGSKANKPQGSTGARKKGSVAAQSAQQNHPPKAEPDPRDKQIADLREQTKLLSTFKATLDEERRRGNELSHMVHQLSLSMADAQLQGFGRASTPPASISSDSDQMREDRLRMSGYHSSQPSSPSPGTYPHFGFDPRSGASGYGDPPGYPLPTVYPHPTPSVPPVSSRPPSLFDMSTIRCFNCSQFGHFARNCPLRNTRDETPVERKPKQHSVNSPKISGTFGDGDEVLKTYLHVKIGHRTYPCLLDSGCDLTILPAKVVPKDQIQSTSEKLFAANRTQIPILGRVVLPAKLGDFDVEISGLVSHHVQEIMIGIDWLRGYDVLWNMGKGEITIGGHTFALTTKKSRPQDVRRVVLAQDTVIPSRAQVDVPTDVVYDTLWGSPLIAFGDWATEPRQLKTGVYTARTVVPARPADVPVRVMNTTDQSVELKKGSLIGDLEYWDYVHTPTVPSENPSPFTPPDKEVVQDLLSRIDPTVPEHIKLKLAQLLTRHASVFSQHDLDLGVTDVLTHQIDTGDSRPVRQPLRRHPKPHDEAIRQYIDESQQQGVIEKASSPWASNVVVVRKKDGTYRCCIDFRDVNELTKKDRYPLPRTDQCLEAMSGCSWFTTCDLKASYHQLMVDPRDREKTAFISKYGMYQYRRMPFGLCNAGASFQRLMDVVLTGLNLEVCLAYIDDVLIFSKTLEEHLDRLELVLQRLQAAGLKLKASKCSIMQTQVSFLGHVLSSEGIATDPEKTRLITQWPVPTNLKELRSFLGISGYYRKFVEGYAAIAAPLNALMKKNTPFIWNDDCQSAFDTLKVALANPPVLTVPGDEDDIILDTDASDSSIGAVLSAVQNGVERPIAYAGRALNKNESNYCITRKELLAVVYFTKYFRQYLLGRRFTIRTDHAALTWLQKTPDPIGQNARWLEQLGEFTFDIKHRNGTHHSNADALSRHPCLNKPSCTACHPKEASATTFRTATPPISNGPERYTGARPQRAPLPLRRPTYYSPPSPDRSPERASDTASRAGSPPPISNGPGRYFGARPQRTPPSLRPPTFQSSPSPVRPPERTPGTASRAQPLPAQVYARDNGSARHFHTPQRPRPLNPTARVFHPTRTPGATVRTPASGSESGYGSMQGFYRPYPSPTHGPNGPLKSCFKRVSNQPQKVAHVVLSPGQRATAREDQAVPYHIRAAPKQNIIQKMLGDIRKVLGPEYPIPDHPAPALDANGRRNKRRSPTYALKKCQEILSRPLSSFARRLTASPVNAGPSPHQGDDCHVDNQGLCWTNEQIAQEQNKDPDLAHIIKLINQSSEKPTWSAVELQSNSCKTLWNEWSRLKIVNGILCRRWISVDATPDHWQVIMPFSYRSDFIHFAHTGLNGGHLGRHKTEEQVRRRAFWPNWRADVAIELRKCDACAGYHRGKPPRQCELIPFHAGEPFEVIAIDITGPFPKSSKGYEYIVTLIDLFSRWAEAWPVRNHTAPVIAGLLIDNFISRFGTPKRILTDQGAEFESTLFAELCRRLEIEKVRSTPYEPRTNACVERFHRSLNSMLAKVVSDHQRDWHEFLQPVMAAYRASKHSSTGYSPNFLVLNRENRAPVDLVLGVPQDEEPHTDSYDEFVLKAQRRMREAHAIAREHLNVAAERRKNDYDIKVRRTDFKVGDWVLYFYPRRYKNKSPKWQRNYTGPFLVTRVIGPVDYVIQRTKRGTPQTVHGDKLRRFHGEPPQSWLKDTQIVQDQDQQGHTPGDHPAAVSQQPIKSPERRVIPRTQPSRADLELDHYSDEEGPRPNPPRSRKRPARFDDYVV